MPSKPVLSDKDRRKISDKLLSLCEELWTTQGYKKTSIKELCARTEIAIGTFYSLYATKEALFFETAKRIELRLTDSFLQTVQERPDKDGLAKAMKNLFREFDSKPFLYNVSTPDFQSFLSKLSSDDLEEIKFENITFLKQVCEICELNMKTDLNKACAVLSSLLSTIGAKQSISTVCDYFEVFDFMIDHLIADLFE